MLVLRLLFILMDIIAILVLGTVHDMYGKKMQRFDRNALRLVLVFLFIHLGANVILLFIE